MNANQVITEMKKSAKDNIRKIFVRHGAPETVLGVKVEDMKKIMKTIKADKQAIALELYDSGIGDAQYLAGLLANGALMSKSQLQSWAESADWVMLSESTVPWVTAENPDGFELALKWIDSKKPQVASSGWVSLACIVSIWPDEQLDMSILKKLFGRVEKEIEQSPNRVKYCMNTFVIAVGSYVKELHAAAIATGKKIGAVEVDMGETSCKVPFAPDYIKKAVDRGSLTKKKKTAKC